MNQPPKEFELPLNVAHISHFRKQLKAGKNIFDIPFS
jgi:hypothetical protein